MTMFVYDRSKSKIFQVVTQDGTSYHVYFTQDGRLTIATVIFADRRSKKPHAATGTAVCHPNDVFDAATGERIALRRALGKELNPDLRFWTHPIPVIHATEIYSAFRAHLVLIRAGISQK